MMEAHWLEGSIMSFIKRVGFFYWPRTILNLVLLISGAGICFCSHAQNVVPPMLMNSAQIQALIAPVALYPDGILAQVVLAARFPVQISKAQALITGYALQPSDQSSRIISQQNWDPSVKALTAFPQVLVSMASHYEWTREVGELYKTRSRDLFQAIQFLRKRAVALGSIQSGADLRVLTNNKGEVIISPSTPEGVVLPQYDPNVVYGAWPYPAYPPAMLSDPAVNIIIFSPIKGAAGMLWALPQWGSSGVVIDQPLYDNFAQRYGVLR
jgi:hypothetical protein